MWTGISKEPVHSFGTSQSNQIISSYFSIKIYRRYDLVGSTASKVSINVKAARAAVIALLAVAADLPAPLAVKAVFSKGAGSVWTGISKEPVHSFG